MIFSKFAPDYTGGLAAYQRGLAANLKAIRPGLDVDFVALEKHRDAPASAHSLPCPLHIPGGAPAGCRALWMRLASRPFAHGILDLMIQRACVPPLRKVTTTAPAVVHFVGTGWDFFGFAAGKFAKINGARFTVWPAVHPGSWGDDKIDLRLFNQADSVFCQSEHESRHLAELGLDARKIRLCGLPPMCLRGMSGDELRGQWGGNRPAVLFLGRRDVDKGYPSLLKAWPMVVKKFPDALLILAGPESPGRQPESPPLPAGTFLDLGVPDEENKARALAACDVFCLPSAHESFGIVYVEAWSYGKPVVCGPAPSVREYVRDGETGLHASQEPESIARAICRLLGDRQFATRLGEAGRDFQRKKFTWEAVVQTHLSAFGISTDLSGSSCFCGEDANR